MGQYKRIKITASVIGCTDLSFLTCPKMEAELAPSWSLWGFEGCLSGVHDNYHPTSCVRACKGLCTVLERYGFQKKRLRYSLMHSAHIVGEDLSRKSVHHFKTLAPQLTPPISQPIASSWWQIQLVLRHGFRALLVDWADVLTLTNRIQLLPITVFSLETRRPIPLLWSNTS